MEFRVGDRVIIAWPGSTFLGRTARVLPPRSVQIGPNPVAVEVDGYVLSSVSYQEKDLMKIPESCTAEQLRALRHILGLLDYDRFD